MFFSLFPMLPVVHVLIFQMSTIAFLFYFHLLPVANFIIIFHYSIHILYFSTFIFILRINHIK